MERVLMFDLFERALIKVSTKNFVGLAKSRTLICRENSIFAGSMQWRGF
ncbi:MAG: hypothetical protein PHO61_02900 [Candidatus ainarchaeum sp.]|nr:hypothetical protein [Candidatus ainarchaeum sp.]